MKRIDKRDRLISAANELFYQIGYFSSTLADIANKADVPLGNVYYYFKTKEEILKAVLQKRMQELKGLFSQLETQDKAIDRLRSFISEVTRDAETKSQFGCSIGTLCQELGKTAKNHNPVVELMQSLYQWVEMQFKALGKGERSASLAGYLLGGLQGGALLTMAFKDPKYLQRQSQQLESWLETVA